MKLKSEPREAAETILARVDEMLAPNHANHAPNPYSSKVPFSPETIAALAGDALPAARIAAVKEVIQRAQAAWARGYDEHAYHSPDNARRDWEKEQVEHARKLVAGEDTESAADLWTIDDFKTSYRSRSTAGRNAMNQASIAAAPALIAIAREMLEYVRKEADSAVVEEFRRYEKLKVDFQPSKLVRLLRSVGRDLAQRIDSWEAQGVGKPADAVEVLGLKIEFAEPKVIVEERNRAVAAAENLRASVRKEVAKAKDRFSAAKRSFDDVVDRIRKVGKKAEAGETLTPEEIRLRKEAGRLSAQAEADLVEAQTTAQNAAEAEKLLK